VERSAATLTRLGADVTKQIFRGGEHTVFPPEVEWLRQHALMTSAAPSPHKKPAGS
jgi:hypothetical protein